MAQKGEYGGGYDKNDAAKDTDSSAKEVSRAWHDAKDEAAKDGDSGVPAHRHGSVDESGSDDSSK